MPSFSHCMLVLTVCVAVVRKGEGFPTGAPASTCFTMYPQHSGTAQQESPAPYTVTFSPTEFSTGDVVDVTVSGIDGRKFKGFEIGAHRTTGNTQMNVGHFVGLPEKKVRFFTCFGGFQNMATHSNPDPVDNVTLQWKAPDENVGNVTFVATVVEDYVTFWTDIETPLFSLETSVTIDSDYEPISLSSLIEDIDFGECGESKGCFLYPRQCSGADCTAAVTYRYRPQSEDFMFELYTNTADVYDYIALGFSEDKTMGKDETFACVSNEGLVSIQQGYNPGHYNERLLTRYISDAELKQENNRLQCRFAVPVTTKVYRIDQSSSTPVVSTIDFDLNSPWYLLLAWGNAMEGSVVLAKHKEMPAISDSMVNVYSDSVVRGSTYNALVYTHAAVMMIAWIFVAGIVTVISRHYKDWLPDDLCCGVKIWFQLHRSLALCVVLLTALGLIFIFSHYGSGIRESATPHAYVGLTVTAAVGVQVIMGLLRPGLHHPMRTVFNWAHWFLGQSAHILAAVTMFLAFDIDTVNRDARKFGFIVLSLWVAIQLVWHLGFEILRWRLKKADNPEAQALNVGKEKEWNDSEEQMGLKTDRLYSVLLALYVITLAGICIACILAFVLY